MSMTTRDRLIGIWRLKEPKMIRLKENAVVYPFGQDAVGFLHYCETVYMFTEIMNPHRPLFAKNGIFNGTDTENSAAINGYQSYCAQYEVKDERIYYNILVSVIPNWHGNFYSDVTFIDDLLSLKTKPLNVHGEEMQAHFVWQRA